MKTTTFFLGDLAVLGVLVHLDRQLVKQSSVVVLLARELRVRALRRGRLLVEKLFYLSIVEVVRHEDAAQASQGAERDDGEDALRDDEVAAAGLDARHALRRLWLLSASDALCATRRGLAREA